MDRKAIVDLYTQIIEGWDIPTPDALLKVSRTNAAKRLEGHPYSMVDNLAHTVFWQELWLDRLRGKPSMPSAEVWKNDWRRPDPSEWEALRAKFISGLNEAKRYAESEPFNHGCDSEDKAIEKLLNIAIHASYHMGQLNVLKRTLRASKD